MTPSCEPLHVQLRACSFPLITPGRLALHSHLKRVVCALELIALTYG